MDTDKTIGKLKTENERLKRLCRFQFLTIGFYSTDFNYDQVIEGPCGSFKNIEEDHGRQAKEAIEIARKLGFDGDEIRSWPGPQL